MCVKNWWLAIARSLITEDGGDERGSVIGDRQHDENKSTE